MSDRDFEIGGRKFKLNKIDAFKQFHIVRRVGPILADMFPAMIGQSKNKDFDGMSEDQKLDILANFITPIMQGFSKLSDDDANLVLTGLLESVEVQQSTGNWARIASNKMIMIQDFELPAMLQIAGRAFMFNLSGFFNVLPRTS